MKKAKGKQIDLLYSNPSQKKPTKNKNVGVKVAPDKRKKKKVAKKNASKNNDTINLDNEIIIGITPKKEDNKKIKKKKPNNKNVNTKIVNSSRSTPTKKNNIKKKNIDTRKRKIKLKIIKWATLALLILTATILLLLSSLFNIRNIVVTNNKKISSEAIISLSGIKKDENMFKLNIWQIKENIKKEPYMANVEIKRKLNGTININVQEREPTYMLMFANSYVYINNQGYMLEVAENPLSLPVLTGFKTEIKDIEPGKRLTEEDLIKLGSIIKIMEAARGNNIAHLITGIDISDQKDYTLVLDTEGKVVHFGDSTKINQKMIWIAGAIEKEKGVQGELFVRSLDKIYFREKV